MRILLALIPAGVFGLAGYAIAFRAIPPGSLAATVDEMALATGPGFTGALIFSIGLVLSWLILRKGTQK